MVSVAIFYFGMREKMLAAGFMYALEFKLEAWKSGHEFCVADLMYTRMERRYG